MLAYAFNEILLELKQALTRPRWEPVTRQSETNVIHVSYTEYYTYQHQLPTSNTTYERSR